MDERREEHTHGQYVYFSDGTRTYITYGVDCVELNNREDIVEVEAPTLGEPVSIVRGRVESIYVEPTRTCCGCEEEYEISRTLMCDDGSYLCKDCYYESDKWVKCERCGVIVKSGKHYELYGDTFCQECYEHLQKEIYGTILGYHRFNDWSFKYAKDETPHPLVTGIELEVEHVESGTMRQENVVWELNKMLGFNTICSRDGSIENGFEIVSQPFSMAFIRENEEKIKEALGFLINEGYRGDQVNTCGLHLHINREAFGSTARERNKNIDKLILFFETYKQELFRFSRRSAVKLKRWAKFLSDYRNVNMDTDNDRAKRIKSLDYIGKTKSSIEERYCAVNLMNDNTVEIRIFKSSLNYKTVFATIELIHTLVKRIVESAELNDFNWNNVVNDENCRYLKDYCELRGISTDKELIDHSEWYRNILLEKTRVTKNGVINGATSLINRMYKHYTTKRGALLAGEETIRDWLKISNPVVLSSVEKTEEQKYKIMVELISTLHRFMFESSYNRRALLITYQKEIRKIYKAIERMEEEECVL